MYQLPVQGQGPVVIHSKTFTFWNAASSPRSVFFAIISRRFPAVFWKG